eukprot:jgi/Chlat1/8453/Chrsp80S07926
MYRKLPPGQSEADLVRPGLVWPGPGQSGLLWPGLSAGFCALSSSDFLVSWKDSSMASRRRQLQEEQGRGSVSSSGGGVLTERQRVIERMIEEEVAAGFSSSNGRSRPRPVSSLASSTELFQRRLGQSLRERRRAEIEAEMEARAEAELADEEALRASNGGVAVSFCSGSLSRGSTPRSQLLPMRSSDNLSTPRSSIGRLEHVDLASCSLCEPDDINHG